MKKLIYITVAAAWFLSVSSANAFDYYGATLSRRELPSSYMNMGYIGFFMHVDTVQSNSPAELQGLKQGDYLLSINGRSIHNPGDLSTVTADKLTIDVLRGHERKEVRLNREADRYITVQPATVDSRTVVQPFPEQKRSQQTDVLPPLKFNDDALEKKYGKTTPEQRDALRQADLQRQQREQAATEARIRRAETEEKQRKAAAAAEELKKKEKEEEERKRAQAAREKWEADQRAAEQYKQFLQQQSDIQEMRDRLRRMEEEKKKNMPVK